jgi:hypothetical protein
VSIGTVLALICIVLGFVVAIAEVKLILAPLEWFVAAIAFELTLGGAGPIIGPRRT